MKVMICCGTRTMSMNHLSASGERRKGSLLYHFGIKVVKIFAR